MMLMEQYSVLQVEEKADSIVHAVKAHVESTNDVSFTMVIDIGTQSAEGVVQSL